MCVYLCLRLCEFDDPKAAVHHGLWPGHYSAVPLDYDWTLLSTGIYMTVKLTSGFRATTVYTRTESQIPSL